MADKAYREQLVDPVCGMRMDPEEAPAKTTYGDRTYYFCTETHRDEFNRHPEQYIEEVRREEGAA